MAVKKFVTGNFYDEAVLFPAVKKTRRAGYNSNCCGFHHLGVDSGLAIEFWW